MAAQIDVMIEGLLQLSVQLGTEAFRTATRSVVPLLSVLIIKGLSDPPLIRGIQPK
jgi:hypothetical protein